MNNETAIWHSLGEIDPELAKKIEADVERVIAAYIVRNSNLIGTQIIGEQQSNIERMALRALKNHFNNSPSIY